MQEFDLIIIGGSAAATAAGVYAARRNLNFKILTKEFGGEVATSGEIENWPGVVHTDGLSLTDQFKAHLAANHVTPEEGVAVTLISRQSDGTFCISVNTDGEAMAMDKVIPDHGAHTCDYVAKAVIVATGVHPRELGAPGEKEFRNKGVTYCTTCDGPLFGGRTTAVIGGGNSALESALMLADIAASVTVINKNPEFKGEKVLIDKLAAKPNVKIIYNAQTTEIVGDQFVTGLKYKDAAGAIQELKTDGVFVHIGMVPNSSLVPSETTKNQFGEIAVDGNCQTNIPGLFAAGDVTNVPFKQIVIAAGQGCIAALSAVQYLNKK
ncbi:MAG TPA: FAD-dependent oxidoreductase [Candidatus Paceibacterota bacterium]|nr:FAD-dependent oxidoreductase [Candidatus Paceibacterota bacterium]